MTQESANHFRVLILGGGTAGIACAARLARKGMGRHVAIVEPSDVHFYQPLWTLVGGGLFSPSDSAMPMKKMIPSGVTWIQEKAQFVSGEQKFVSLGNDRKISFDWLIVATGVEMCWSDIKGAKEALEFENVSTIYDRDSAAKTFKILNSIDAKKLLFTFPSPPVKCAGAPQKIMYLADEILRRRGLRENCQIEYVSALPVIFGVPVFAQELIKIINRKNISTCFNSKIIEVRPSENKAIFANTNNLNEVFERSYDYLHLVPPMKPHKFVRESDLAVREGASAGWVDVDAFTLQHKRWPHVFALGDVSSTPNAKTGASIRKQAPVLIQNLMSAMNGKSLDSRYDGYASCPLITGFGKVILAEFGYENKLMPTFGVNPTKERLSMWILKVFLLPKMYWNLMMKGLA